MVTRSVSSSPRTDGSLALRTVADIVGLNHFKFLLDVWVEEPIEVEPVWALLPTSEVGNLVAVHNVAPGTQLGHLADLRIDCCKEQP